MIRKLTLVAGFGAGYVLGAKAGQERYSQIVSSARAVLRLPAVQEATTGLQEAAGTLADRARDSVHEGVQSLQEKVAGDATVDLTNAGPSKGTKSPMAGAAASRTAPDLP